MMSRRRIAITFAMALALVATGESWAARGGGKSGGAKSGARSAGSGATGLRSGAVPRFSRSVPAPMSSTPMPFRHHHHGRAVIFVGAPFLFWSWPYGYYYLPPPYYYGPDYLPRSELPPVYVEKFDGTPTPQTPGEIYCPSANAHYPEVKDCPNGWQRIIREDDQSPADAYAG